jgi:hypothetical protein
VSPIPQVPTRAGAFLSRSVGEHRLACPPDRGPIAGVAIFQPIRPYQQVDQTLVDLDADDDPAGAGRGAGSALASRTRPCGDQGEARAAASKLPCLI